MRKQMEEEIRAQLEANASAMMSWDDKVTSLCKFLPYQGTLILSADTKSLKQSKRKLGKICKEMEIVVL